MAKVSPLILLLVVMGLIAIHFSQVTSSSSNNQEDSLDQESATCCGPKKETSFDGRADRVFQRGILAPGIASSKSNEFTTNDDDHSNVELDKLNDGLRYEILPAGSMVVSQDKVRNVDSNNIARLLSKILRKYSSQQANDLTMNQIERKRSFRQLATPKEDKDYSFVLQPLSSVNRYYLAGRIASASPTVNGWAKQKLRDMLLTNGKSYRYSTNDQISDQLLQARSSDSKINDIEVALPEIREKRRRCKIDPNLGVKNPSFCDTDAYFGAADYSVRDVWDSAGRR